MSKPKKIYNIGDVNEHGTVIKIDTMGRPVYDKKIAKLKKAGFQVGGKSGNPNGRPKGSTNVSTRLRQLLAMEISLPNRLPGTKGKSIKTISDGLSEVIVAAALRGDKQAIKLLLDRAEGKVADSLNINANVETTYKLIVQEEFMPEFNDDGNDDNDFDEEETE